jgi:hypothetical protein
MSTELETLRARIESARALYRGHLEELVAVRERVAASSELVSELVAQELTMLRAEVAAAKRRPS